jgi:hypothetical protein
VHNPTCCAGNDCCPSPQCLPTLSTGCSQVITCGTCYYSYCSYACCSCCLTAYGWYCVP